MAKIFMKTHNPYALCAITHSLTLRIDKGFGAVHSIQAQQFTVVVQWYFIHTILYVCYSNK